MFDLHIYAYAFAKNVLKFTFINFKVLSQDFTETQKNFTIQNLRSKFCETIDILWNATWILYGFSFQILFRIFFTEFEGLVWLSL